jgi:hypothetical protein
MLGCLGVFAGALGSLIAASSLSCDGGVRTFFLAAGTFGIVTCVVCWIRCLTDAGLTCIADGGGVTGPSTLSITPRRIPWDQIEECRIRTQRDVFGRAVGTVYTLHGSRGQQLLSVNLAAVSAKEREAFLAAVRARLGSSACSELIAAEAPTGLGTELEATQAPAGRGTEPEADIGGPPGRGAGAGRST